MVLEVIQREIPVKGTAYIILRDCPEDRLGEALSKGMDKLKKASPQRVWATSLPEGEPLHNGPVGVWRLTHVHDMVWMERATADLPQPRRKLATRPLKRASDDKQWAELVNRAFREVPNAATVSAADVRKQNHRCGLALDGDKVVGAYEVDLSEKVPELVTLAIEPELWRQGYGRDLLLILLEGMKKMDKCTLRVSTANPAALALYESLGFTRTALASSWFQVE